MFESMFIHFHICVYIQIHIYKDIPHYIMLSSLTFTFWKFSLVNLSSFKIYFKCLYAIVSYGRPKYLFIDKYLIYLHLS